MEQHPDGASIGMPDPNYIQTTMFDERLPKALHEVTVKAFPEALAHVGGLMSTFASVSHPTPCLCLSRQASEC